MKYVLALLLLAAVCHAQYYLSSDEYDAEYPIFDEGPAVSKYSNDWYTAPVYRHGRGKKKGYGSLGGGGWGGWGGGLGIRYGWQDQLGWGGWGGWGAPPEIHHIGSPVLHLGGPPVIHQGPPKYIDSYYPVTINQGWGWGGGGYGGGGGFGGGFGGGYE